MKVLLLIVVLPNMVPKLDFPATFIVTKVTLMRLCLHVYHREVPVEVGLLSALELAAVTMKLLDVQVDCLIMPVPATSAEKRSVANRARSRCFILCKSCSDEIYRTSSST